MSWRPGGADAGRRSSRLVPRRASSSQRVHDRSTCAASAETAGQREQLDPDTYTSPESYEIALLAAGAAVDAVERVMDAPNRAAIGAGAAAGAPRRARPRDGILPVQQRRGRRGARAVAQAPRRSRSSTTTCITATARSTSSRPIRTCCTSRRISIRSIPAPVRPTRSAAVPGAGSRSTCRSKSAPSTRTTSSFSPSVVIPVLRQFAPDLVIVSAGFDAHERDPLGGMRLTTPAPSRR